MDTMLASTARVASRFTHPSLSSSPLFSARTPSCSPALRCCQEVTDEFEQISNVMFGGLPHWGKNRDSVFDGLPSKYPDLPAFLRVRCAPRACLPACQPASQPACLPACLPASSHPDLSGASKVNPGWRQHTCAAMFGGRSGRVSLHALKQQGMERGSSILNTLRAVTSKLDEFHSS